MAKTIFSVAAAAALALALASAAGARGRAGTFTYCTDPTFPPMELTSTSGAITGFDVDMAASLAKTFGESSKALKTAFPGLIAALNAKKCDAVISGIFVTPDRLKQAGAAGYMETHRVFIVKAGTKYEDYLKTLKAKIGFNLQGYPGDNDAVAQVILGRADVVLTQDTSFAFQATAHPGKIAVAYTFPQKDTFGVYYRKGDALGAKIAAGLKTLKSNGTLAKLAKKYKIPVGDVK
ncbi:MAG: amino acid ABC transporter substrate-binding protein [Actinobacteria bacterium]|nr:MAG: amino acid ABC transporter substrate-binding protein [Actinomycetota bacterium]